MGEQNDGTPGWADADAEIQTILKRLETGLDDRDDPRDATTWQTDFMVIRDGISGQTVLYGKHHGLDAALKAAQSLLHGFDLPQHVREKWPRYYELLPDLRRLFELVYSRVPRTCAECQERFFPSHRDEEVCHDCRTGLGRVAEIWTALNCWWKWGDKQTLPRRLADRTDWNDFRQAFHERFAVLLGDYGAAWDAADVKRQQLAWAEFELWLRQRKSDDLDEHDWRETWLRFAIAEVTKWLRDVGRMEPLVCTDPAGQSGSATATDLLATMELATLARVGRDRFHNVLSGERRAEAPDLPIAVVKGSGSRDDQFSYAQVRPFLLRKWLKRAIYFPESIGEVKSILSANEQGG